MTKEYTNQMTHSVISYHLLAHVNHWAVVAYHIPPNSPGFMIQHDNIWHGISPWPVCVICPGSVPSNFLVHPRLSHCQGGTRRWKVFGSVQAIKEKKQQCFISIIHIPKHNTIPATREKNKYLSWKTRTLWNNSSICFYCHIICLL